MGDKFPITGITVTPFALLPLALTFGRVSNVMRAKHWRQRAEELRTIADHLGPRKARDELRKLADDLERIAERLEKDPS